MDLSGSNRYIFLDPDGTQEMGLIVIVAAPTGVTHVHQCGGLQAHIREVEGFAVPLGGTVAAQPLRAFFRQHFQGNPPAIDQAVGFMLGPRWSFTLLDELAALIGHITFWRTYPDSAQKDDERAFLELDRARLDELTEAWIPVSTVYGGGILLFANSD